MKFIIIHSNIQLYTNSKEKEKLDGNERNRGKEWVGQKTESVEILQRS